MTPTAWKRHDPWCNIFDRGDRIELFGLVKDRDMLIVHGEDALHFYLPFSRSFGCDAIQYRREADGVVMTRDVWLEDVMDVMTAALRSHPDWLDQVTDYLLRMTDPVGVMRFVAAVQGE